MRITTLFLILACQVCLAGSVTAPDATGEWSEVVNGLRGRLLFAKGSTLKNGVQMGEVYLELQNVSPSDTMYVYYAATKSPLHCELSNSVEKGIKGWPGVTSDFMPSACWLALPYDSALRLNVRIGPAFGPNHPCLFISVGLKGGAWEMPLGATNDYYLSGTFTVTAPKDETHPQVWEGTLLLPQLRIAVKAGN